MLKWLRAARPWEVPSRSAGSLAKLCEENGFETMIQFDPEVHYLRVTATSREKGLALIVGWEGTRAPSSLVWRKPSRFPEKVSIAELRKLVAA